MGKVNCDVGVIAGSGITVGVSVSSDVDETVLPREGFESDVWLLSITWAVGITETILTNCFFSVVVTGLLQPKIKNEIPKERTYQI